MADVVYVGSTVRVTADFQAWTSTSTPVLLDPSSVAVTIKDTSSNVLLTTTGTRSAVGVYYVDWTPPRVDNFTVVFTATFPNSETSIVTTLLDAVNPVASSGTPQTLEQDQYIEFMINVSPLYIDPESVQAQFPDAPIGDITELIYQYSSEANEMTGITNLAQADPGWSGSSLIQSSLPSVTPFIREFVQASVNCALTRIYDIGAGGDELQIALADLQVTRRNSVKGKVTRANATTWCELAGVIRDELLRTTKSSGIRAVMRGERVESNPIPVRTLQHQEWRSWYGGTRQRGNDLGGREYY